MECIRGSGIPASLLFNLAYNLVMLFALLYVSIVMFKIFRYIRTVEKQTAGYNIARYRPTVTEKQILRERERSRFVAMQGIFYSGALFLVCIWPLTSFISAVFFKKYLMSDHPISLIMFVLTPLHGFFNSFIYLKQPFASVTNSLRVRQPVRGP